MPNPRLILSTLLLLLITLAGSSAHCAPIGATELDRETYANQIEGFWLAQSIANWTGLQTEGRRQVAPFYTDTDWPLTFDGRSLQFVTDHDPWPADDDTDIEYVYAALMNQHYTPLLNTQQIRNGWLEHINRFIWVSNARARELMDRGVAPPATSIPSANELYLRIDAQLTTEFFGMLSPGMPAFALEMANLPITATARGHAAHASQFLVVLHAMAATQGQAALNAQGIEQLIEDALAYIPATSKAADIVNLVLEDFRANPNPSDWERTRDLLAQTFQTDATANGYKYIHWTESSVNFGSALICLLYGQGDLKETIRIGTLTGWDSDNPTATMGGLIGLMLGADGVRLQFPGKTLSDRYWITRTRDNMEDHLPEDPQAEDSFTMLAQRMLERVDDSVTMNAGIANSTGWLIPPQPQPDLQFDNPLYAQNTRSANNSVRAMGGSVTASHSLSSTPISGMGVPLANRFADGGEHDPTGRDVLTSISNEYFWSNGAPPNAHGRVTLTVSYSVPVEVHTIRFIEGDHFADGGWFNSLAAEALIGGKWILLTTLLSEPLNPSIPFQIIDLELAEPMTADAIRVSGVAGGTAQYITAAEIDAFSSPLTRELVTWDINKDGMVDIDDLYDFNRFPTDLDDDGSADQTDADILEQAIRWRELELFTGTRP